MAKWHLTAKFCETLTPRGTNRFVPDAAGRIDIGDTDVEGLIFRVARSGLKSWCFLYRPRTQNGDGRWRAGKQKRLTFGRYPLMGLKEARQIARGYREQVLGGGDPRAEEEAAGALTFQKVYDQFCEKSLPRRTKHPEMWMARMRKHVLPAWRDTPIHEVSRGDVHKLLDEVLDVGPGAAREVRKQLHTMFVWAVDREIVASNPLYRLQRPELAAPKNARTPLDDDQIRAVWELDVHFVDQLRLLLLTGCRKVEVGLARWEDVSFEHRTLTIPAERHKGGRETVVPLSRPALEILEARPRGGEFVFGKAGYYIDTNRLRPAQRRLDWHLRLHDLRATAATRLGRLGIAPNIVQLCLGHSLNGLLQIYDKHSYLDERRDAMERLADHLLEVVDETARK